MLTPHYNICDLHISGFVVLATYGAAALLHAIGPSILGSGALGYRLFNIQIVG